MALRNQNHPDHDAATASWRTQQVYMVKAGATYASTYVSKHGTLRLCEVGCGRLLRGTAK